VRVRRISIAIADADRARQAECTRLLEQTSYLKVVAQTFRRSNVLPLVVKHRPKVLILDLDLVGESADDPVSALCAVGSQTTVVLLETRESEDNRVFRALAHGARGYITADTLHRNLCSALERVVAGEAWIPRKMLGRIVERLSC
jgi:DNA-binding NarL/FixJ family response regulator